MNTIFLEVLPPIKTSVDPKYLLILLFVIIGMVGLRFYNVYKENSSKKNKVKIVEPKRAGERIVYGPRELDKKEFNQVISIYQLTKDQAAIFAKLCKTYNIIHALRLVENKKTLTELFDRALEQLNVVTPSNREIEQKKTLIFTMREAIENKRLALRNSISTTRSLQNDQSLTFIVKSGEHYPLKIIDNSNDGLVCPIPRDSFGNELRLPLWSKIQCIFSSRTGQAYHFPSRILRFESGLNETKMLLSHSNNIKAMPNRNHDRKAFETACQFCQVTVANVVNGKHTEHKFYPLPRISNGVMLDISVGGCSIKTSNPLGKDEYLQITCTLENKTEEKIIGKVKRVFSPDSTSTVMNIQFAKMSRTTMNRIFSYIYNKGV